MRNRIRERIEALDLNVAEVERRAGLKPSYLHEFLSGKKETMRGDAPQKIAVVLKTTDLWLMRGIGEPGDQQSNHLSSHIEHQSELSDFADDVEDVSSVKILNLHIDSLNVVTGEATCRAVGEKAIYRAFVVDPAVYVIGNKYTSALLSRQPLTVTAKTVTISGGRSVLAIIDTN